MTLKCQHFVNWNRKRNYFRRNVYFYFLYFKQKPRPWIPGHLTLVFLIAPGPLGNITLADWVLKWARSSVSMLYVREDLCHQALENITLTDWALNRARSSVSMPYISEDLCHQALGNITCNTKLIEDCIYNNTDYPVRLFTRRLAKLLLLVLKKYLRIIRLYKGKDMLPKRYNN